MIIRLATGLMLAAPALAAPVSAAEEPVAPYVMSDANAGATPIADPAVFAAFNGREGVARIVAHFIALNRADPRIGDIFAAMDVERMHRVLGEQFCYILGGPCSYSGRDMASAHKDMGLQTADMGALVGNLQLAMDREGVPFRAQNRLLAKLAPMKRVVVER